jgi:hypothetical protein
MSTNKHARGALVKLTSGRWEDGILDWNAEIDDLQATRRQRDRCLRIASPSILRGADPGTVRDTARALFALAALSTAGGHADLAERVLSQAIALWEDAANVDGRAGRAAY